MQLGTSTIPLLPAVAVGVAVVLAGLVLWGVLRARGSSGSPPVADRVEPEPEARDWTGEAAGGEADPPRAVRRPTVADAVAARGADTQPMAAVVDTDSSEHPAPATVTASAPMAGVTSSDEPGVRPGPPPAVATRSRTTRSGQHRLLEDEPDRDPDESPAGDGTGDPPSARQWRPRHSGADIAAAMPRRAGSAEPSSAGESAPKNGSSGEATVGDGSPGEAVPGQSDGTPSPGSGAAEVVTQSVSSREATVGNGSPGEAVPGERDRTAAAAGSDEVAAQTTASDAADVVRAGRSTVPSSGVGSGPARTSATVESADDSRDQAVNAVSGSADGSVGPASSGEPSVAGEKAPAAHTEGLPTPGTGVEAVDVRSAWRSLDESDTVDADDHAVVPDVDGDEDGPEDGAEDGAGATGAPTTSTAAEPVLPPWSPERMPVGAGPDDGADADCAGSPEPVSFAVQQALAARAVQKARGRSDVPDLAADEVVAAVPVPDARDRLLSVLLSDPATAVGATTELDDTRARIDQLGDVLRRRRADLATAVHRLHASGLSGEQIGELAGLDCADVREILQEPSGEGSGGR